MIQQPLSNHCNSKLIYAHWKGEIIPQWLCLILIAIFRLAQSRLRHVDSDKPRGAWWPRSLMSGPPASFRNNVAIGMSLSYVPANVFTISAHVLKPFVVK